MVVAPVLPPAPTPPPNLSSAFGLAILQPRSTAYGYDDSCLYTIENGVQQCATILSSCYNGFLSATNYNEAATSCLCNYGVPYLDCYFSQVATGSCASYYGLTTDFGDYQMSFYTEYCGSIPASAMAHLKPPTSVSLQLQTVHVVTATGALHTPDYGGQPNYKGSGGLLSGPCRNTDFTRVDAGSTVYYAGFMGCIKDRPECCPWAVATATAPPSGATTDGAPSNGKDGIEYDFPQPSNSVQAQLATCADDYYSISGGCCPIGFWPFTSQVGGITPCWSSIHSVSPPTLTVGKDDQPKPKPTSAVINIVWSMRYELSGSTGGGLSTAAIAGIGAGGGVAAILIAGLSICLWRHRRKNRNKEAGQPPAAPPMNVPLPQPDFQQPQMIQQPGAPINHYPYPQPGVYAVPPPPGMMMAPPPCDRTSMTPSTPAASLMPQHTGTSNGGVSELSSLSGHQNLLQNAQPAAGYFLPTAAAGNGRAGTGSPAVGANGQQLCYPAPIAEADEGHHLPGQQYAYQHPQQQQQQQQQQFGYQQPQPQQYYAAPGQDAVPQDQGQVQGQYHTPQPQAGYGYPPPQQQQQQYQGHVPEMSAQREAEPPQEVAGSRVQY